MTPVPVPGLSLTFSFDSTDAAYAFLARLGAPAEAGKDAPPAVAGPAPSPASAGKGKKDTTTAAPAASPTSSTPATSATPDAEPSEGEKKALYEKLKIGERIQQAAKDAALKPKVVELLGKYGVKKGPELAVKDYEAFGDELDKILAPAGADDLG